jgi:predicted small lipoprotein YifL
MKKISKHLLGISAIAITLASIFACKSKGPLYTPGTIKLTQKEDDVFSKNTLRQYLKSTTTPTIVLRVASDVSSKVLQEQNKGVLNNSTIDFNAVYNTVEKELAKSNFIVRDRALYQKVFESTNTTEYSQIKELTNTDLILEIIIQKNVPYATNKYIDSKDRQKMTQTPIKLNGSKVEFKIIHVKSNDLVGSYTFFNTPCVEGCKIQIQNATGNVFMDAENERMIPFEEAYDKESLELFYEAAAKRLIKELLKN